MADISPLKQAKHNSVLSSGRLTELWQRYDDCSPLGHLVLFGGFEFPIGWLGHPLLERSIGAYGHSLDTRKRYSTMPVARNTLQEKLFLTRIFDNRINLTEEKLNKHIHTLS